MSAIRNVSRKIRMEQKGDNTKDENQRGDEQKQRFAEEDRGDANVSGYSEQVQALASGALSKQEKKGQKLYDLYSQIQELQDHEDFVGDKQGILDATSSDEDGNRSCGRANNLDSLFESTEDVIENRYGDISAGISGRSRKKNQELLELIEDMENFEVNRTGQAASSLGLFFKKKNQQHKMALQVGAQAGLKKETQQTYDTQSLRERYLPQSEHDLTILQNTIFSAIEQNNIALLVDLGAHNSIDLNFFAKNKYNQIDGSNSRDANGDLLKEKFISENFKVYPIMIAVAKGEVEMIQLLLQNRTLEINVTDPDSGINAVWLACLYGHGEIMSILAENGADIYVKNRANINVMHLACFKNHVHIVEMLIKSGFPIDSVTENGMTPLHIAARMCHTSIAEMILQSIFDSQMKIQNQRDIISKLNPQTNLSPLSVAILMNNQEIAKILIEHGAKTYYSGSMQQKDLSPIFLACEKENTELLEAMCDHGASLTVQNSNGQTPLMFSSNQQKLQIVNYLSLRTKDLNIEDTNCQTILMQQLFADNIAIASKLVVRGSKINYVNRNGQTALHLAIENMNKNAIRFLLKKGAEVHIMDLTGEDACDKAKRFGIANEFKQFQDCSLSKKIIPMLPSGKHPKQEDLPLFKKQKDERDKRVLAHIQKKMTAKQVTGQVEQQLKKMTTQRYMQNDGRSVRKGLKNDEIDSNILKTMVQVNLTKRVQNIQDEEDLSVDSGSSLESETSFSLSSNENVALSHNASVSVGALDQPIENAQNDNANNLNPGDIQAQLTLSRMNSARNVLQQHTLGRAERTDDEGGYSPLGEAKEGEGNRETTPNDNKRRDRRGTKPPDQIKPLLPAGQNQLPVRQLSLKQQQILRLPTTKDGKILGQIVEASESDDTFKTENSRTESMINPPTVSNNENVSRGLAGVSPLLRKNTNVQVNTTNLLQDQHTNVTPSPLLNPPSEIISEHSRSEQENSNDQAKAPLQNQQTSLTEQSKNGQSVQSSMTISNLGEFIPKYQVKMANDNYATVATANFGSLKTFKGQQTMLLKGQQTIIGSNPLLNQLTFLGENAMTMPGLTTQADTNASPSPPPTKELSFNSLQALQMQLNYNIADDELVNIVNHLSNNQMDEMRSIVQSLTEKINQREQMFEAQQQILIARLGLKNKNNQPQQIAQQNSITGNTGMKQADRYQDLLNDELKDFIKNQNDHIMGVIPQNEELKSFIQNVMQTTVKQIITINQQQKQEQKSNQDNQQEKPVLVKKKTLETKSEKGVKIRVVKNDIEKKEQIVVPSKSSRKKRKQQKPEGKVRHDENELLNLSWGSFGSFDKQVNDAENMIADIEEQLNQAITSMQNKQKTLASKSPSKVINQQKLEKTLEQKSVRSRNGSQKQHQPMTVKKVQSVSLDKGNIRKIDSEKKLMLKAAKIASHQKNEPEDSMGERLSEMKFSFYRDKITGLIGNEQASPGIKAAQIRYEDESNEQVDSNENFDLQSYQIDDPQTHDQTDRDQLTDHIYQSNTNANQLLSQIQQELKFNKEESKQSPQNDRYDNQFIPDHIERIISPENIENLYNEAISNINQNDQNQDKYKGMKAMVIEQAVLQIQQKVFDMGQELPQMSPGNKATNRYEQECEEESQYNFYQQSNVFQ